MSETSHTSNDWVKAIEPRPMVFPQDHGPHRDFRIEWWYYTGNLEAKDGHRLGFQLTFFRTGMQSHPTNPSRWTVRDLYIAHFAIADITKREFHRFERSSRGGMDWAGAADQAERIWNGPWELRIDGDQHLLKANQQRCAMELTLRPTKEAVPHGENGLSRKGSESGNASYYYSFTRMETVGTVTVDGKLYDVTGTSWMDHEFSSSFLEKGQQGWDWFSIQLDDGSELMLYQIRGADGTPDTCSSGTLIHPDGKAEYIKADEMKLAGESRWKSPTTSAEYPLNWIVEIPHLGIRLSVKATFPNQEMDTRASTGIVYWEGSVDIAGKFHHLPARGRGYLEMTGYGTRQLGKLIE